MRGEVSRLRKLGVPISSEPYRLMLPVESDVGRVQAMLRRGAVREAAEHYTGPLLPLSDAPGVVRHRNELDGWLRHAVITGGDQRGAVGVGAVARRQRRRGGLEARAGGAGVPRSAPQPGRRAAREAARVRRVSASSEDLRAAVAAQGRLHTIDLGGAMRRLPGRFSLHRSGKA